MLFRSAELAAALGGRVLGPDTSFPSLSIDSRSIIAGQLFVPLVAERDGHDYIAAAVDAGAAGYLSDRGRLDDRATAIAVDDTARALTAIGRLARSRLPDAVVAITGSVGKTSVKDLAAAACAGARRTHASERSFNNELGVPITVANAPDDTEVVVVEMGARGAGHIAELCAVAQPTVGIVTTVALAHSELFGSLAAVAAAKGELIEALPADGTAVLNADDPLVAAMADRSGAPVLTFGRSAGDVRASAVALDDELRPSFRLDTPVGSAPVRLAVRGEHMALNGAAAVAAALAVGVDLDEAVAGVQTATLSPWRMEVTRAAGLVVINDAYNANPTSMRAAIAALASVDADQRVAVVGPMAELGEEGPAEHRAVVAEAGAQDIRVVAVDAPAYGPGAEHVTGHGPARAVVDGLRKEATTVAVLVKGSRVAELERLAAALVDAR